MWHKRLFEIESFEKFNGGFGNQNLDNLEKCNEILDDVGEDDAYVER